MIRLEHANICVRNLDATIHFLKTAFPEFHLRGEGRNDAGLRWIHIGTEETYIALNEASTGVHKQWKPYAGEPGVNHLAFEVDDVESLRVRLTNAGFRDSTPPNAHPFRKRLYFYDPDGNDWEFIQYLSSDAGKRNDYILPDV